MHITSMIIEGFKSYGKRVEVNGFDKEFNAITGLNGTGKSNVLDAICFVLGITNLGQIRASSLQDLVYKSGQAGVTKASVSIKFDNRDKAASPMGYEAHDEITVTRQVQIGGKNKYMINGSTVQNKRAYDMFCSVQLNVNNPHFLIMQGRITKVLNMKPAEILSMVEEAAGTSLYENKRISALKMIEKKDARLLEIATTVKEVLGPRLSKLKEQRSQYLEFQRIERELEHCQRIYVAWEYVSTLEKIDNTAEEVKRLKNSVDAKQKAITDGEKEVVEIEHRVVEMQKDKDSGEGSQLEQVEADLKAAENEEHKLSAESNSGKEGIKAEAKLVEQLKTNITEDEAALAVKEKELEKVGELFKNLKEAYERDSQLFAAAQDRFEKISSGLLVSEDGGNATLEQQLMTAKQNLTKAKTEMKQCEMTIKHSKEQLAKKQSDMRSTDNQYKEDSQNLEKMERQLLEIEDRIKNLNYDQEARAQLEERIRDTNQTIFDRRAKVDNFEAQNPSLRLNYQDPHPGFDRNSVKGIVANLFTVRDQAAASALEVAAGGRLFNVIVDTEKTGKKLLERGQLQQRVTMIPLNKISGNAMDPRLVRLAEDVGGKENVRPALSLIEYDPELTPAMRSIFGQIFICKDMDTAKKVTFHKQIMRKCVTLDGDVYDPAGTLSGGAASKRGALLIQIEVMKRVRQQLQEAERLNAEAKQKIARDSETAKTYNSLKQNYDLKNHEVGLVRQRLQQTSHHKLREEVEALNAKITEMTEGLKVAKRLESDSAKRAAEIEEQLKDAVNIRDRQLKAAETEMKEMKKRSTQSRDQWQRREQESETLNLEITELRKTIDTGKAQLEAAEVKLATLREAATRGDEDLKGIRSRVKELQNEVRTLKEAINRKNKEIQKLLARKDEIGKQRADAELEITQLKHDVTATEGAANKSEATVKALVEKFDWIEQDKAYFGTAGGMYDFVANPPADMGKRVKQLEKDHDKLGRNLNTRAMDLLGREEEEYTNLMKKKKIVENDKRKILETIKELDEKKKEILKTACEQVNKDFGSIFSSLLPGADAKLEPPENKTFLDGLEVKIGFSGKWKESLSELSGGQRSLIALSLILAMLLFKPAPLYILDEVDAALDLSHTQNIGTMLKRHFKRSQFVIVSLKDGMFNNANVLFRTKFVDGFSAVTRTESAANKKK